MRITDRRSEPVIKGLVFVKNTQAVDALVDGRALRFVPAAALAALVFPALTHPAGYLDLSVNNFRLLAGLSGAIVAWKTRNVLLTILIGMLILWSLEAAFGVS